MKTLIPPSKVFEMAFTNNECLPSGAVTASDIAAAERRWIRPALGAALHARLVDRPPSAPLDKPLAAAVALFTRALLQPRLDIHTDQMGTTSPGSSLIRRADERAMLRVRRELIRQAQLHLTTALEIIGAAPELYPEYRPQTAIRRVGGIIFG